MLAIVAPGGVLAVFVTALVTRQQVAKVERSVGPVNGEGSIQSQAAAMRAELELIRTSIQSQQQGVTDISRRVDGHDRELRDTKDRVSQLEVWRQQFHVDDDERLG